MITPPDTLFPEEESRSPMKPQFWSLWHGCHRKSEGCLHCYVYRRDSSNGIRKGESLGYNRIALVADSDMPHLVRLYESIGFVPADHRQAFGVDFQRMIFTTGAVHPDKAV